MPDFINSLAVIFLALFITIDVIGLTPIFLALTSDYSPNHRKKAARQGVIIATGILFFFVFSGSGLLNILGIGLPAFRIAGGILLLILSIDMVLAKPEFSLRAESDEEKEEIKQKHDISVFPLAIPLLSGPATITLLILFMAQAAGNVTKQLTIFLAIIANMIICWVVLHYSVAIARFLGRTGINVLNRIFGILLTALACQFFIDGISEAFFK